MLSYETADLLTTLETTRTFDDLWSTSAGYLERLGVTHSIYTYVQPGDPGATRAWTSPQQTAAPGWRAATAL